MYLAGKAQNTVFYKMFIDLSEHPAKICISNGLLSIERENAIPLRIPAEEVQALVASHPQITFTKAALVKLAEAGALLITCGINRKPVAMNLPLIGHHMQTRIIAAQATLSLPKKKKAWKQIVRTKIKAQAKVLEAIYHDDCGLMILSGKVRSGDPTNLEARAASKYWKRLFGANFVRFQEDGTNACLNYGYAVLRAIVARSICGAGLHPSLGVHHHNRFNAYCLADDLMEPWRPLVDTVVFYGNRNLSTYKQKILNSLAGKWEIRGQQKTLFEWMNATSHSLVKYIFKQRNSIYLPEVWDVAYSHVRPAN